MCVFPSFCVSTHFLMLLARISRVFIFFSFLFQFHFFSVTTIVWWSMVTLKRTNNEQAIVQIENLRNRTRVNCLRSFRLFVIKIIPSNVFFLLTKNWETFLRFEIGGEYLRKINIPNFKNTNRGHAPRHTFIFILHTTADDWKWESHIFMVWWVLRF